MRGTKLYSGHVPLNGVQKAALAMGSALFGVMSPQRADLVAALGETTGESALERNREKMLVTKEGRSIMNHRPRIREETLMELKVLPETTFGGSYWKFMSKRGFSPDERPPVRFVDDEELAYVATRYREVHDFWHVIFDCPTTILGELALKTLEYQQTGLPMCALSVAGGQFRLNHADRRILFAHYLPWALRTGSRCKHLLSIEYEKYFDKDLEECRKEWSVETCPKKRDLLAPALP
ncbi:ubiquinone biosynthesis protein Coq4 [Chloropicon primus]|uniref:Ubiquinone biosynthesis protein COQ4 homolog, mitochondrial n=2 Tax=Chloropicon primus TaxID=1764295 RepID=A0A5B8MER3_9CHLO|nr:ubiquinone biosynthesis protein Coq4 [Chloropicon primus]UPQ97377.1 ubiquinone biosynthesis protein Coq4 [Chloropicon primus]|eukprot:QDZ18165.1 ubiquinone biosynthesis protein Coq4 [Chloropicon primus]